jgi:hypothetical protein
MAEAVPTEINIFARDINFAILKFKESNKNELFQKLFELMTFECGKIWVVVLHSTSYTQTVGDVNLTTTIKRLLEQLESIFYSKSKWIKVDGSKDFDDKNEPIEEIKRIVKESYRIEFIPSKLFLEFLLFVARQIRYTLREDTAKLACLGTLARRSDQESVLNIAQETNNFFMITTEPTTMGIFEQILAIYKDCGVTFSGNISISHIIGQLCEGITGTGVETELSQSTVEPTMNVRSEIEQVIIDRYKARQVIVQPSPPGVKGGITKPTKPISSIRNPSYLVLSSRTNAPPDATKTQSAAVTVKAPCPHGVKCYRRHNKLHEQEYSHPEVKPHWKGGGSGKSKRSRRRPSTKRATRRAKRSTRRTTRRR